MPRQLVALEFLGNLQRELQRLDAALAARPGLAVVADAVEEVLVFGAQGIGRAELGAQVLDVLEGLDRRRLLAVDLERRVPVVEGDV